LSNLRVILRLSKLSVHIRRDEGKETHYEKNAKRLNHRAYSVIKEGTGACEKIAIGAGTCICA